MGWNRKYWRLRFHPLTGYGMPYKDDDYYQVYMKNSSENFVFLVDHLQDVFEVKIGALELGVREGMNVEKMKPYVEWMNGFNWELGKIPALRVVSSRNELSLKFLLENLKQGVERMDIEVLYCRNPIKCSSVNFKVDVLTGNGEEWLATETMKSIDPIRMDLRETHLSNLDMNQFLRSWKEGTSNGRIQEIRLPLKERVKWRTMLDGLDAELGDFRRTRKTFRFTNDNQLYQLHGGFDITRADGRMATIGHHGYNLSHEDNPWQQFEIEECARISRVWNLEESDEEDEIEKGDGQGYIEWIKRYRREERRNIFMIVW
ncbi:Protein CBG07991 [Caenorhabditis briggsae]|uniref:Protein CBG07991 n=1 Tax=Caenorhabditis briggsae TaxID=6238 RepID=A8X5I8_CAEBR|nr:Protein CBG07991 [Caenorhabditis briggsae]CAP27899.1 Protein CBG07991 [Caenorhabditis briggsae]